MTLPNPYLNRVVPVDTYGNEINAKPTGSYMINIKNGQLTGIITTGAIWAMRNGATLSMYIRRIHLFASFAGTVAATTALYELMRFNTATPSGGSAYLNPIKKRNTYGASTLADARYINSGTSPLTVTSVVFESPFASLACPRQLAASNVLLLDYTACKPSDILVLAPNEGLAISIPASAVVGDSISGVIEWEEA
jgi:hypothetical protein